MPRFGRGVVASVVVSLTVGPAFAAYGRRIRCELRCGHRITECVLARGGVDGAEIRPCRREALDACVQRGRTACPLPTREQLAATLVRVQSVEAAVHQSPLCAAIIPPVPVAGIDEAIAAGVAPAAALAGSTDPDFGVQGNVYRGGAFEKLFVQGTSGHGAAFVPLGNAVRALAHPARGVTYFGNGGGAVYGVVGVANGAAIGLLLTSCPVD